MKYISFVACILVVLYGLFRPEPSPNLFEQSDKFLPVLAFGALSLSSRLAFQRVAGWPLWGVLLLLAPLLEWLQYRLQPARQFNLDDILANLLGVTLAFIGVWLFRVVGRYLTAARSGAA